jgi:S-disulfanyl-L-cysteine oxidoreductase SoxD
MFRCLDVKHPPRRFASPPSRGAHPAAWQSQFRGCPGLNSIFGLVLGLLLVAAAAQAQPSKYPGVGRDATPKEVAAWDIDVRADFKGLPAGSGSVAKGQEVWEAKCASCHGYFGESGEVFNPLIGGTTAQDIKTGKVARLNDPAYPSRTTLMKVATLSSLWDYINRAMPWTQPKSLTTEEVYAVTAFMLNLGGIVPDGFVLSDKNIREVQQRMPNRHGMSTEHALWPGNEFGKTRAPDTRNVACMSKCLTEAKVSSYLPDFARNAHGNLAEQNRLVGAQLGVDTTRAESKTVPEVRTAVSRPDATSKAAVSGSPLASQSSGAAAMPDTQSVMALLQKHNCSACHAMDKKVLGPSYRDIAKRYPAKPDYLTGKIKAGGAGVWGPIPMPAQTLSDADAKIIALWLAGLAGGK